MFGERHIEQLIEAICRLTVAVEALILSHEDHRLLNHLSARLHGLARKISVVAKAAQKLDAATTVK